MERRRQPLYEPRIAILMTDDQLTHDPLLTLAMHHEMSWRVMGFELWVIGDGHRSQQRRVLEGR